jgi:hypothetical protein
LSPLFMKTAHLRRVQTPRGTIAPGPFAQVP